MKPEEKILEIVEVAKIAELVADAVYTALERNEIEPTKANQDTVVITLINLSAMIAARADMSAVRFFKACFSSLERAMCQAVDETNRGPCN